MEAVYANAYLNLSATSATSPTDGLSSSHELHPRLLTAAFKGDVRPGPYRLIEPTFWRTRVADAVVNTRGWVVQERVLASRVLHYTFDQVAWECLEVSAAEEFPDGLPHQITSDFHGSFKQSSVITYDPAMTNQSSAANLTDEERQMLHNRWSQIIRLYGRCDFTESNKDKLIAISGVVRALQKRLRSEVYLAGLWRSNMYGDLLWEVDKGRKVINGVESDSTGLAIRRFGLSTRATAYRAPSWSWASVDGMVKLGSSLDISGKRIRCGETALQDTYISTKPRAGILEVSLDLVNTEDPLGQVKGGQLMISGRLYRYGYKKVGYSMTSETFRATGEFQTTRLDEQVQWTVFDEAWFLPLILRELTWHGSPPDALRSSLDQKLGSLNSDEHLKGNLDELVNRLGPDAAKDWTQPAAREWADRQLLRNGVGCLDAVLGIVVAPSQDGKAFRRIGMAEVRRITIDRLDDLARVPHDDVRMPWEAVSGPNVNSEAALAAGDLVEGVFVIV